jgi:hypothetical protein
LKVNQRFGETFRLHLPSGKIIYENLLFHAGFLLGLFFDQEDGSDMLLQNVG